VEGANAEGGEGLDHRRGEEREMEGQEGDAGRNKRRAASNFPDELCENRRVVRAKSMRGEGEGVLESKGGVLRERARTDGKIRRDLYHNRESLSLKVRIKEDQREGTSIY